MLFLLQEPRLPGTESPRSVFEQGLAAWHAACALHAEATAALAGGSGSASARLAEQAQLAESIEWLGGWERRTSSS